MALIRAIDILRAGLRSKLEHNSIPTVTFVQPTVIRSDEEIASSVKSHGIIDRRRTVAVIKAEENAFSPIAIVVPGKLIDHAISGVSPGVGCAIKITGCVGNQITPRKIPVATLPKRVQ
jgi:hypothetical protein